MIKGEIEEMRQRNRHRNRYGEQGEREKKKNIAIPKQKLL